MLNPRVFLVGCSVLLGVVCGCAAGVPSEDEGSGSTSSAQVAVPEITLSSWQRDPHVVAIDAKVETIFHAMTLHQTIAEPHCPGGSTSKTSLTLARDDEGRPRKLDVLPRAPAGFVEYAYDERGNLIYGAEDRTESDNSVAQIHTYYEGNGKAFWSVYRVAASHRDLMTTSWTKTTESQKIAEVITDPAGYFAKPPSCE